MSVWTSISSGRGLVIEVPRALKRRFGRRRDSSLELRGGYAAKDAAPATGAWRSEWHLKKNKGKNKGNGDVNCATQADDGLEWDTRAVSPIRHGDVIMGGTARAKLR